MEPRYLVYRSYNGKIHAEIQYGIHHTGEGIRLDNSELKRIKLTNDKLTLTQAIKEFPYVVTDLSL